MKRVFLQGLIAGVLAAIAGVTYLTIYKHALDVDFGNVVNPLSIIISSVAGTMLIACVYALLLRLDRLAWTGYFNVLVAILSFASIIGPISASLPLEINSPELFPGLVVPMHFFPALAYFTIAPFFRPLQRKAEC